MSTAAPPALELRGISGGYGHTTVLRGVNLTVPAASVTVHFDCDEWIWTESSYKYSANQIVDMGADAGFATRDQWVDEQAGFALTILAAM